MGFPKKNLRRSVYIEQHEQATGDAYRYLVVKLINTLAPAVGSSVSAKEMEKLIDGGVHVNVEGPK